MDFLICKDAFTNAVNYFRKSLFDPIGTTYTDVDILPVETLESGTSRKLGKAYDATITYLAGDIVSDSNLDIFIAKLNSVNVPLTNTTYWLPYNTNGLEKGLFPVKAWCVVSNSGALAAGANIISTASTSTTVFEIFFDSSAYIEDVNYIVHVSSDDANLDFTCTAYDRTINMFRLKLSHALTSGRKLNITII